MLWLAALALGLAGCAGQNVRPDSHVQSSAARHVRTATTADAGAQSALEDALHDYYQNWRGVPYRYGGQDESGIDCSSFVRRTLGTLESLNLPRTTAAQAKLGEAIDRSDLSPGDLVFFKTGGNDRHVGIYVGNGRFMHASTSDGVTISRLNNVYWRRHYWQSRRVLTATN